MTHLYDIGHVVDKEKLKKEYDEIFQNLIEKYGTLRFDSRKTFSPNELFDDFKISPGYAQTTYTGKLKEHVDVTELELSMILDNGFSHFGGKSTINSDRSFRVIIYTD